MKPVSETQAEYDEAKWHHEQAKEESVTASPQSARELAREALEIAEKATQGPWVKNYGRFTKRSPQRVRHFVCFETTEKGELCHGHIADKLTEPDADLCAFAGTHLATLARAVLSAPETDARPDKRLALIVDEIIDAIREAEALSSSGVPAYPNAYGIALRIMEKYRCPDFDAPETDAAGERLERLEKALRALRSLEGHTLTEYDSAQIDRALAKDGGTT